MIVALAIVSVFVVATIVLVTVGTAVSILIAGSAITVCACEFTVSSVVVGVLE